jgi:hypothetical protein
MSTLNAADIHTAPGVGDAALHDCRHDPSDFDNSLLTGNSVHDNCDVNNSGHHDPRSGGGHWDDLD